MDNLEIKMVKLETNFNNLKTNNSKEHKAIMGTLKKMSNEQVPKWRVEMLEKVVYGGLGIILLAVLYKFLELIRL